MFLQVVIIMGILGAVLNGFVLKIMWGWFVTPTFGIHPLSFPQAIGLAMIVSVVTSKSLRRTSGDEELRNRTLNFNLQPLVTLMVGYLVHLFM